MPDTANTSNTHNNVFLTTENLAFAMPLILLCSGYAYFTYVPLKYAIPILLGLAVLLWIRFLLRKRKEHKLTHLDEKAIQALVGEEEEESSGKIHDKARTNLKSRNAKERKGRSGKGN